MVKYAFETKDNIMIIAPTTAIENGCSYVESAAHNLIKKFKDLSFCNGCIIS